MIRVVDKSKAVAAGVSGALAAAASAFLLRVAGAPVVDLVHALGTIAFPDGRVIGYAAGLLAQVTIGIAWALFYAYFFWSRLKWPPTFQGLVFALIPAALTILFVYPQLKLMQLHVPLARIDANWLLLAVSPGELLGILAAHAVYGLVMGTIYTRPVGYRVGRTPRPPQLRQVRRRASQSRAARSTSFMFATGIECSYPTIDHGRWRRDEMQSARHYEYWQRDFELCREMGITHLRYGPPLHLVLTGPGKYDWSRIDEQMAELDQIGPEPIIDLCHFGVPDWLENFQNPEIVTELARYAGAFAKRYPWVRFYTPVNEMYVCARMSALDGLWNEQRTDEAAFVNAVFNLAGASVEMSDAILRYCPDAVFINSETSECTQPCCPDADIEEIAAFENDRRFLPLDLIYAHSLSDRMRDYLKAHHVKDESLARFNYRKVPRRSILGIDYYKWNERLIDTHGRGRSLGELFGWYVIASQYYDRYKRPLMHTETNTVDAADAPRWLWRQWYNVQLLRKSGVPLVGFTWYSLTDQIDWNDALEKALGVVYPVGLFDLNRDVRDVGLSYKHLIDMFRDCPDFAQSQCLAEMVD